MFCKGSDEEVVQGSDEEVVQVAVLHMCVGDGLADIIGRRY